MARRPGKWGRTVGLCLLSTVLYHLAFPSATLWPLAWIALAPMFYAMAEGTPGKAALGSGLAGCGMALLSLSGFRHLTIAAYISPAILAGVYYAAVGAGISWIIRKKGISLLWIAPPIWTAYEFLRSVIPVVKFPWLLAGQTQVEWLTFIQAADLGGVYILSFVVVSCNAYIAQALREGKVTRLAAVPIGLVLLCLVYGAIRIRSIQETPGPRIALVQGNVPQEIKLSGMGPRMIGEYTDLTRIALEKKPRLVVWPETMYPWPLEVEEIRSSDYRYVYEPDRKALLDLGRRAEACMLIGALRTPPGDARNSAYYFSETGEMRGRYDKIDLVPLSEAIPFAETFPSFSGWIRETFLPPGFGQLQPGEEIPVWDLDGSRFAASICYEISFSYLARIARRKGADFLVSISNDAWFKDGGELDLARDQAVFRAVEYRVGIARAANTGISSFVDPTGRSQIIEQGGERKQVAGVLVRPVMTSESRTVYGSVGDLFAWIMVLWALGTLIWTFRKRRK